MTTSLTILDCFTALQHYVFFFMLGRYLAEFGGLHILNETRVIEKGPLKSLDIKDPISYLQQQ